MSVSRFLVLLLAAVIVAMPIAHAGGGPAGDCAAPHAMAAEGGCCDEGAPAGACHLACQAACPVPVSGAATTASPDVCASAPAAGVAALFTGSPRAPDTAPPKVSLS
jgi:hypothetical protein